MKEGGKWGWREGWGKRWPYILCVIEFKCAETERGGGERKRVWKFKSTNQRRRMKQEEGRKEQGWRRKTKDGKQKQELYLDIFFLSSEGERWLAKYLNKQWRKFNETQKVIPGCGSAAGQLCLNYPLHRSNINQHKMAKTQTVLQIPS